MTTLADGRPTATGIPSAAMRNSSTTPDLHARARAALNAAVSDPLLDGLVGWYAMEASHLGTTSIDGGQLVAVLAGARPDVHLHAGYAAEELAAAGVLRVVARSGCSTAA